jgi:autotransporter-associated beta strand protein
LVLSIGSSGANGAVTALAGTLTILSDVFLVADSTFTNLSPGTLTFGGALGGTAALVKSGPGTVLFFGTNTYSGNTTITDGILQIGSGGSSGVLSPSGQILNNGTLVFNRTGNLTQGVDFGPVLSGSGSIIKLAGGTLVLTEANTYTGDTTVLEGIVTVRHSSGLGSGSGRISIAAGAALELQGAAALLWEARGSQATAPCASSAEQTF